MKRFFTILLCVMFGMSVMAQQKIQLRSADRVECTKSDMTGLKASFSFSTIEAEDFATKDGEYSWLSMPNTVLGGNEGDPQIPVINELIAVPVGAQPTITVTSYSSREYKLSDMGIKTLVPRQPSLRKDKTYDDVPFVKNEAAYKSTRGFRSEPKAVVNVVGTMRGVQLGKMTIEPVSYDPVNNIIRVFNDIEVEVSFDGADSKATEDLLVETYSPYFNVVYKQLFNDRMLRDAYSAHPDLYTTPVKMLVVTTSTYANSDAFNAWKTWKIQKGIDVDVLTVANSASASTIKTQIYSKYNSNHPSFLVIVGDETVVTYYQLWDYESTYGNAATDLEYASVDGDVYHDMFLSRIPVSSTTELSNYVNKALTYEKYTMSDPSYLSNVLLIAGADGTWAPKVGRPTINYAANNYFNTSNGFTNVYKYVTDSYTGCYNYLSSGVGFANYTAHGDIQKWHSPELTNSGVEALTNNDKYFWAMGNCCLTCNFKNAQNSQTCFGETMIRVANKGAFGYIGSVPESYWYEDYYFGVGATSTMSTTPSMSQTQLGVYDMMFDDTGFNTLNAVPYAGNVAVTYAHANSYTSSVTDEYYWRAYQCFGDGSIMPYHTQPAANNVSHANTINIGAATFAVSAAAGSYVAITKNNEILGVAEVPSSGTVNVPISGLTSAGDVMIVVTRQQRQPYITTIQAISNDGPYISLDSYTPIAALVGQSTNLSMTFKNVGNSATSGTTTVTLSTSDTHVTINNATVTFGALAANATTTVSGLSFTLNNGVTLGNNVTLHYRAVNGSNTWEGDFGITPDQIFTITANANNANYGTVSGSGQYHYGESCTVTATPADGYMFTSWTQNGNVVSTTAQYVFSVNSDVDLVANFASGVMIGDGGSSTSEFLPSYNYYNYSLTEQIYTSAEMGGAGIITSVAFYNEGAAKTRTYDFYMKNTTKSTFTGATDWITVTSSDKVFSGSVTMVANDWTTITFSAPFVYDGTSNVVLVADDNTGTYTNSPHMACRVFTATSQALYAYNDGTNYNPLSPPTSSSTNNAVMSSKNQIVLTKEAIPTESFNITVSANPAQAATVTGGGEYQYGQTCTVTATPNTGYTFTGWTENGNVVSTDLSYSFTATNSRTLVANFIMAIEIGEGTTTHNYLPTYNYYNYSMTEQIYTANEIGMAGTITCIAFYNEGAEKTRTLDFYLKATTKESFSSKTDWITVAASDKVFSGEVTLTANTWAFVNFTTPFEYDGMSNLVLVVDDNTGEYTSSPHLACSVFNTSSTQAIYIYSDGTNYNPASPTTSQSSNYATLSVKNHILMGITPSGAYTINASASPAVGGTVTGGGTFEEGESCTLTATANTGYNFTNWTMNGSVVSTNATYTFNVTASGSYVANFTAIPQYTITIKPNDVEKGSVAFGSKNRDDLTFDFEDGWQGWTTFQGNTTSPHTWMHNTEYTAYDSNGNLIVPECHNSSSGMMLSESYISASTSGGSDATAVTPDNYLVSPQFRLGGSFTFYAASRMSNYPAEKFSVLVSTAGNSNVSDFTHTELTVTLSNNSWNEYTIDLSEYSGMGYVAIRHYDCNDQHLLYVDDVTITEPEVSDGSVSRTFYEGESCTVVATAAPDTDYFFANWTENGDEVSTSASYTFTVTGDREIVANFTDSMNQSMSLNSGWNWWSTSIVITLADLQTALVNALSGSKGSSVITIKSQTEQVTYDGNTWRGQLNTIEVGKMYEIKITAPCEFTVEGKPVDNVELPIIKGNNWVSLPVSESTTLTEAFGTFPVKNDIIKSNNGSATYTGTQWRGKLETIDPGEGYIYKSASEMTRTLSFDKNKNKNK